jgi:origin recognition complex subunit 2
LLKEFSESHLDDTHVIEINGYFPNISIKIILVNILYNIQDSILTVIGHSGPSGNIFDQLLLIQNYFIETSPEVSVISLLIHNIDGQNLRTERTQTILASLASIPQIHLICSIDHINAPLMWDTTLLDKFNFLWHDLTTFEHYDVELSFENRLLTSRNQVGASGAIHVLSTLNENAQSIFNLLLKHQIELKVGMAYQSLLRQCMENFVCSSESGFKTHLTEFKDHKLIMSKMVDKGQVLYVPFDESTLQDLLERLESNKC